MSGRHTAYVCMGSNMGDSQCHLAEARASLASLPGWRVEAASPVYLTEPQNVREQPWFANQVLKITCPGHMTAPAFFGYAS